MVSNVPYQTDPPERRVNLRPRVIRTLSRFECMQSALHVTRQMCGTMVTCRYALAPEIAARESLTEVKEALQEGIARVVLQHPMLQVAQMNEDSALPSWVQLDGIDMGWHIQWDVVGSGEDYEGRFRRRVMLNMDTWFQDLETRPGWRVSVMHREGSYESVDVTFAWNHAHMDGIGGKLFHESLLRSLNDPKVDQTLRYTAPGVLDLPNPVDRFPPKLEELVKYPITAKYVICALWDEYRPRISSHGRDSRAHWCPIKMEPFKSAFETIVIDPVTLKNLVTACRQHDATITALLHALCMVSLALRLPDVATGMECVTPIDHRRFIPSHPESHPWFDPHETMANIVTVLNHIYPPSLFSSVRSRVTSSTSPAAGITDLEDTVWSTAAKTRGEIRDRLKQGLNNDMLGLLKFVKDWRVQMRRVAKKPRGPSWGVTNLGVIDGGEAGKDIWRITRSWFQISTEATAPAITLSVVSVKGGEMMVDIGWQKCTMDASIAEGVTADLKAWLEYLGRGSKAEQ